MVYPMFAQKLLMSFPQTQIQKRPKTAEGGNWRTETGAWGEGIKGVLVVPSAFLDIEKHRETKLRTSQDLNS
jgi:hypothetical protein